MGSVYIPTEETFPTTAQVVVVGGGIVGVATAYWLTQAGLSTIVLEMRDGLSTLTTPNSVECFRAQFTEPAMVELAKPSIEFYENFSEEIKLPNYDISLHQQGYLFLTDNFEARQDLRAAVETHHQLGVVDSEFLEGDEARKRFPYLGPAVVAATFRQMDGWLSSHEVTQGFAKASDATFLLQTRATGIEVDQGGVCAVVTDKGTIHTRAIVNAAGPYAGVVGRMVDLDLPLEPVRRQKAFIMGGEGIPMDAPMTIDLERDAYWRPEAGGAYIGWVDSEEPPSEPAESLPTDWDFPAMTIDKLNHLCPFWSDVARELKSTDIILSAGQYVYTPDDQPLIGMVPQVPGFYLNCGYWAGVMLAPMAGKRVADLITGELAPNQNPLRPTRFEEGIVSQGQSFLRGRH
jgi:sarcosine oxidase subunit beta